MGIKRIRGTGRLTKERDRKETETRKKKAFTLFQLNRNKDTKKETGRK